MSRIGKKPIPVPPGVEVAIEGNTVRVRGPKGELARTVPQDISVVREGAVLKVTRAGDAGEQRALHGLTRTLVANMVEGVTHGYSKALEITGVGYRAAKQGRKLVMQLGYSHPVEIEPPAGIEFEVPAPTKIVVRGLDKELVGEVAADVRRRRPPEPYKGKGIHYEGERLRHKVGKTGKAAK
ncbi:MAG TPA: 50S ribosomal protein L6 [Firmicutes bacterium]|uniref:50S ribosomal protein L6 n=1 Tax=Gelria sp. Kuro-4 TaxID=2796927 RepID=UPI001989381F|nr:50S ribosomal protein L6 [Gelria sp. Kuro-4]BCV24292.1 50S ribosomal protein L6 [Gelria sp. Kuro-4]HHV56866.1 50S ribosomal protein L6 [Bacillota bacterium]